MCIEYKTLDNYHFHSLATMKRVRFVLVSMIFLMSSFTNAALSKGVDSQIEINGSLISISFAPDLDALKMNQQSLLKWIRTGAQAVADYYDGFPVNTLDIVINGVEGTRVNGTTYGGLKPMIILSIGNKISLKKLQSDWVLVHELVHLAFPSVRKNHHWIEEGLATYVEPIVRVRAGLMSEQQAWRWILSGVPKGQPKSGDKGLDYTPTWGRTYWGGALFCLVADYEIRLQTNNKYNIGDALRAITKAGGTMQNEKLWSLSDALKIGDKATGKTVLMSTYRAMKDKPMKVDLLTMWKNLGVTLIDKEVVFDEMAQQSALRRTIFEQKYEN